VLSTIEYPRPTQAKSGGVPSFPDVSVYSLVLVPSISAHAFPVGELSSGTALACW
jgi:hypothetical protein